MKLIDLIGQRYGKLTVVSRSNIKKSNKIYWNCICDCGKETIVSGNNLRTGKVISCGCAHQKAKLEDLTGQHFGDFTVLKLDDTQDYVRIHWICQCNCGNVVSIQACHLKSGRQLNCGCKNNVSNGENKIKEILLNNNISFKQHYYVNIDNKKHYYDFYINNQYFIEYDGSQHFYYRKDGTWNNKNNFIKLQESDNIKNQYCLNNNIPLIRIPYTIYKTLNLTDLQLETTKYLIKE